MNTQFSPYGEIVEHFESYSDIEDWFYQVGLNKNKKKLLIKDKNRYLEEIIDFRTLLRTDFKKYIESKTSINQILKVTNEILIKSQVHPQVIENDSLFELQYIPKEKIENPLLTKIAIEVIKLLSSQEFKYLKKCDNHKCSLFFIDTSKNHSRRWCSMEICGNRSKVNNFTKRKKNLPK